MNTFLPAIKNTIKMVFNIKTWNSDVDQQRLIPDAEVIFDVGANIGQTTKTYRALFPHAGIWSFEPDPRTFQTLKNAIGADPDTHLMNIALSDTAGCAELLLGEGSLTNSLLQRTTDATKGTVTVACDTIDNVCFRRSIPFIDILKIDVEGAEAQVLRGAEFMLGHRLIRAIFVEVYFNEVYANMHLFNDLNKIIQGHGFRLQGIYSLVPNKTGAVSYGNALYLLSR